MSAKKCWREKLADSKGLPRVFEIGPKQSKRWGEGTCVIPAPLEVESLMRAVPKGKLTTIDQMRQALARAHGTTIGCPITTGIFAWIAANAAEESATEGIPNPTPFWRTLKTGGELNPKYPGGIAGLRRKLRAEGHTVIQKGKRYFVRDFESKLAGC